MIRPSRSLGTTGFFLVSVGAGAGAGVGAGVSPTLSPISILFPPESKLSLSALLSGFGGGVGVGFCALAALSFLI